MRAYLEARLLFRGMYGMRLVAGGRLEMAVSMMRAVEVKICNQYFKGHCRVPNDYYKVLVVFIGIIHVLCLDYKMYMYVYM